LSLSHAPSYLAPRAINTTAPATAPVAPPSPRQSWPGARRHAPHLCLQQQPPVSRLLQSSASRTPARVLHAPAAAGVDHYALPVPFAAAPLARVGPIDKRVRARALQRLRHPSLLFRRVRAGMSTRLEGARGLHSGSDGGGGTMHASTRPGSLWRTGRCVHGQRPVWDAALQLQVIAETCACACAA
jgi:hypothetical protein